MIKEKIKKNNKGIVTKIDKVSGSSYYIEFETAYDFVSKPGQYVSILCDNLTLRRPFSISYNKDNAIGVLFKEKGEGTRYIKGLSVGDSIDFIGPLGNGFDILNKKSLLIGAGIGIAPIFYLKDKMEKEGIENLIVGAFLNKDEAPSCVNCDRIVTNDGSLGACGSVLDYLESYILEYKPEVIYSCGPSIVLKKVAELAQKYSIKSQIAMEKVMACGIGVCRGCVIKISRNGLVQNATICKDGPVFAGEEVVWEM